MTDLRSTSGELESATSALQSSRLLYLTVLRSQSNQRAVQELKEELEALNTTLEALQKTAANTDIDLSMLRLPLFRCTHACREVEGLIVKSTPHYGGSRTSFRDWAKLKYMGNDIVGFKNLLAVYRSTIMIALADAHMRRSHVTAAFLREQRDFITDTGFKFEQHLQEIEYKLQALLSRRLTTSDKTAVERRQILEERESVQQIVSICARALTEAPGTESSIFENVSTGEEGHQVIVSLEDLKWTENLPFEHRSVALLGQTSDASSEQALQGCNVKTPLGAGDDSSIGGLSEHGSAPSVTSLADSIFSITSGSSRSSVVGPTGAGEMLVAILLRDNDLSSLYEEVLERVTADRFERNFRRILKDFAVELRNEAETPEQKCVARFVRYRARNSAHVIRNSICSPEKPQEDVTPNLKVVHEALNLESDGSDNDSGPDHEDGTNLQQLENFIITSQAFIKLRHDVKSFIYRNNPGKIDNRGTNFEGLYMAASALCLEPDVMERCDLLDTETAKNENLQTLNSCNVEKKDESSSPWRITRFVTQFREYWEPQAVEGKIRVRWKCKCGQSLYDDFTEMQPGAAKRQEELLNRNNEGADNLPVRYGLVLFITMGSLISNLFTKVRRTLSTEEQGLPVQQPPPTESVQHLAAPQSPLAEALFLLVCHNVSNYDKKLLQLSVCEIESDEKFFRALRKHYRSQCNKWWSFISLRDLTGIRFVRFEMYRKSQSVDIRLKDDIPPPGNPDYCYAPVPIDLMPPVGENMLMHLFNNPDCAEDVRACLDRFPKKLREKLACGDKAIVPGWGLHLEEGVCKTKTIIVYMVCLLVSSIWGVLWTILGHDIQSAFTVSAYMIGITVPLVTLMQHLP